MNSHEQAWQKLVAAARQAPAPDDGRSPYGFATRVAGLAFAGAPVVPSISLEKFALRGLFAAGAFSLAAVAFGFTGADAAGEHDPDVTAFDAVTELLDFS